MRGDFFLFHLMHLKDRENVQFSFLTAVSKEAPAVLVIIPQTSCRALQAFVILQCSSLAVSCSSGQRVSLVTALYFVTCLYQQDISELKKHRESPEQVKRARMTLQKVERIVSVSN